MAPFYVTALRAVTICAIQNYAVFAFAQQPQIGTSSTVTVNGTAELTKSPEQLRLQLRLFAKGPDIASARTQLGAVQKDAASQLVDLGADKESITFGEPAISTFRLPYQQQLQQKIEQRRMELGRTPSLTSKAFPELPVVLEVYLQASWNREGSIETQLYAHEIQETVKNKALDLTGMGSVFKVSAAEQELGELLGLNLQRPEFATPELSSLFRGGYPSNQSMDIRMFQVARITKQERLNLFKEAFKKSKDQASDLAQAAETPLGRLMQLSTSASQQSSTYSPTTYSSGIMANLPPIATVSDTELEVVRPVQPISKDVPQSRQEPLNYRVTVNAVFRLETP